MRGEVWRDSGLQEHYAEISVYEGTESESELHSLYRDKTVAEFRTWCSEIEVAFQARITGRVVRPGKYVLYTIREVRS